MYFFFPKVTQLQLAGNRKMNKYFYGDVKLPDFSRLPAVAKYVLSRYVAIY